MHDESGNLLRGSPVFWESSNPAIASVSQDGVVNGKQPGAAKVAANAEGKTGYADVTVSPGGPASVTVDPRSATVLVGLAFAQVRRDFQEDRRPFPASRLRDRR